MAFEVKVDATSVRLRLEAMPDQIRNSLRSIVQTLDNELLVRVQEKTPVKTGLLRDAIHGHVRSSKTRVSGTVNVDKGAKGQHGIAAILESGASVPAHDILPDVRKALAFMGSAGQTFAAAVHHPADTIPKVGMFEEALAEMEGDIVSEMETAVQNAVR